MAFALLLVARGASADEPPPGTVAAPGAPSSTHLVALQTATAAPPASVTKSQPARARRFGFITALGVTCINALYADDCFGVARVGFELAYVDLHVDAIGAAGNGVHADDYSSRLGSSRRDLENNNSARIGFMAGFGAGTRYYTVARFCRAEQCVLRLAGRANADAGLLFNQPDGHFVGSLTVGPNMTMQLTHVVQVYVRLAPGFSVIDNGVVTFTVAALGGLQLMF
jgi:hypothetical protein